MSRDVSKEKERSSDIGPHGASSTTELLRTFSDPQLHGGMPPDGSTGIPLARSFNDRQNLAFGRVDEWVNVSPSPQTPVFPTFEYALAEDGKDQQAVSRDPEAFTFGGMEPVRIPEARQRADVARERSTERGRSRGLGVDIEPSGKDKEKENVH